MAKYLNMTHKVTIFGTCFGLAEEWTTSFSLGNVTGGDLGNDPEQAQADAIKALWQTLFTNNTTGFQASWKTEGVKVALTDTDGKTIPGSVAYSYFASPIAGATPTAQALPPQCSLVVTLTTPKLRGYGSKGRMFLPGIGFPVSGDGRILVTQTDALATQFKTFLDGVNALPTVGGSQAEVVLNSAERLTAPTHAAIMTPVTGIKVGNVYDTQRRRRNQLQEIYQVKALA